MMKPLEGIRVLELARVLAGPWCGQLLADLGAEVTKVERPVFGDDTRHWGPPFVDGPSGERLDAAYFHATNRGKRSIAIDITSVAGQREIRELVRRADVVIENYKVGSLAKYGLDYAGLTEVKPDLVYCSITGFGQSGPYSKRAGYDFIIQGMGGFMSVTGEPDGPPQKAGVAYADIATGLYSTVAILAALRRRDCGGGGAHIDMALLDTQIAVLGLQAVSWMVSGEVPRRSGNGHFVLVPYQAFDTDDGELIIAVGNDAQFARLCDVLGLNLADDSRFETNAGRVAHRELLLDALAVAIRRWPKQTLADRLEACGVPAGPINHVDDAFADPQVVHRGLRVAPGGYTWCREPHRDRRGAHGFGHSATAAGGLTFL